MEQFAEVLNFRLSELPIDGSNSERNTIYDASTEYSNVSVASDVFVPDLSQEMLVYILTHLPVKDILNARLVCRNWMDAASYTLKKKVKTLTFREYEHSEVEAYRHALISFKRVNIIRCVNVNKEFINDIQKLCPKVDELHIASTPAKWYGREETDINDDFTIDVSPLCQLKNLKILSMKGMGLSLRTDWLRQFIDSGPPLDMLILDIEHLTNERYRQDAYQFGKVLHVKELHLNCHLGAQAQDIPFPNTHIFSPRTVIEVLLVGDSSGELGKREVRRLEILQVHPEV